MEDYSLALKKVAKFPKAFPEHHGSEEKAGKYCPLCDFASPTNILNLFRNSRTPA